MIIEQGSQAYRLAQMLDTRDRSPPDHVGTILFMARLLKRVAARPGEPPGYSPRIETI